MQYTLKDLTVDHPYYCSESNYYSNDAAVKFSSWSAFISKFGEADVDMNLCFRWDIREDTKWNHLTEQHIPQGTYDMMIFIMGQRKGKFIPVTIKSVLESDVESIVEYLTKHHNRLKELWRPLI